MKELIFHLTDYETMTFFVSYFVLLSLSLSVSFYIVDMYDFS